MAVVLASSFNGADGATSFTAETGQTTTFVGTAQLDTAIKKLGSASLLLDGNSDVVTYPDDANWYFAGNNFTIQCFVYFASTTGNQCIACHYFQTNQRGWVLRTTGTKIQFFFCAGTTDGTIKEVLWTPSTGQWYHLMVCRNSNELKFGVDGSQVGSTQDCTGLTTTDSTEPLSIGALRATGGYGSFVNGQIDSFQIDNTALYTSFPYTVPTSEYGVVAASGGYMTTMKGIW
jgi:hypothetical protein